MPRERDAASNGALFDEVSVDAHARVTNTTHAQRRVSLGGGTLLPTTHNPPASPKSPLPPQALAPREQKTVLEPPAAACLRMDRRPEGLLGAPFRATAIP